MTCHKKPFGLSPALPKADSIYFYMTDPAKLIEVFQGLLGQLEQTISLMPQLVENGRTDNLNNQIQSYQTKIARIKNVLRKNQDHERRRREIQKQNRTNDHKR